MLRSIGISFRKLARKTGGIACREREDTFLLYCPHRDDYEQLLKKFMKDLYVEEDTSEKVELRFGVFVNAEQETEIEDRFACEIIAANNIIEGEILPEIGYHIRRDCQRKGYAKEAARIVRDWAFRNTDEISIRAIRQ